jgi:hypothetical protein
MNLVALAMLVLAEGNVPKMAWPQLDFGKGNLFGWEVDGDAFYATTGNGRGPSLKCGVCSSDRGVKGRTGLLRREFVIPAGVSEIRFHAYAARAGAGKSWRGNEKLDVLLAAAGKRVIPKLVRTDEGWLAAAHLLPRFEGKPREYRWDVAAYSGRTVQIVIGDDDDRPGAYVYCSGFRLVRAESNEVPSFVEEMAALTARSRMAPATRFDSRHFTALSNADERLTRLRLKNCELIHGLFFEHFARKGFDLQQPSGRLMVAIFDSQAGFEAYLGQKMSPLITGIYHHTSNRLVVYDYGRNEAFLISKKQALERVKRVNARGVETVERVAREIRTDINIGTIMHEVAHQLSFNTGMLNRHGDVPVWLAEGLACYCESTDGGAWQGIGEPNPERLASLARQMSRKDGLFRVQDLAASDRWRTGNSVAVLTGYAQSWALFRLLMEEQPGALKKYMALIHGRKAPDHRLTDFRQVFGADLRKIEKRYKEYLIAIAQDQARARR